MQLVYKSVLKKAGYQVDCAGTAREGLENFTTRHKVILLDLMLPDRDGLDLMVDLLETAPKLKVIVITANGSINRAVQAMRGGAFDFLVKPFDDQRLVSAVANALIEYDTRPVVKEMAPVEESAFHGFIGSSSVMQEVYQMVQSIGRSMATVFITGESGTGKEVCAQAVHDVSNRATGPFIPLNCGAIPADLLESEVFGHLKGSFTGAITDKTGAAAAASGGTLFLDEICEMDLGLQTKLLRFLQTSTIQPVGAVMPRKVDVRIICATNRDPFEEVKAGRFREDLFYRLHVVPIHLPPLRTRGNDVNEISKQSLIKFSKKEGKNFTVISDEVQQLFQNYSWPGNVRQLLNVLWNVIILNNGSSVELDMLPSELRKDATNAAVPSNGAKHAVAVSQIVAEEDRVAPAEALVGLSLAEIERVVIEATIARYNGSVPKASRVLDVSPSTIYRKRESWATANDG